jgi:hypothetical protein
VEPQVWDAMLEQAACLARAMGAEPSRMAGLLARWRRAAQGGTLHRSRLVESLSD